MSVRNWDDFRQNNQRKYPQESQQSDGRKYLFHLERFTVLPVIPYAKGRPERPAGGAPRLWHVSLKFPFLSSAATAPHVSSGCRCNGRCNSFPNNLKDVALVTANLTGFHIIGRQVGKWDVEPTNSTKTT